MAKEPQFTASEMRANRRKGMELTRAAIASWNKDRTGSTALVILTYREYLRLTSDRRRK